MTEWEKAYAEAESLGCVHDEDGLDTRVSNVARALLHAKAEAMREARAMQPLDEHAQYDPWWEMERRAAEYERAVEEGKS